MRFRKSYGWLDLALGIMLILLGVYSIIHPIASLKAFVMVYGLIALFTGIVDICMYVMTLEKTGLGGVTLIGGILSVVAGFLIPFWPGAGVWVMTILFPIWFIAHSILRLCNLSIVKMIGGKGSYYLTIFVNIIGLILGVLILFSPLVSAISLALLIGIYLVALGIGSTFFAILMLVNK